MTGNDLVVEGKNGVNGSHAIRKPSVISHQLREELIRILTAGDAKSEGAFTIAIAAQVEKFAIAAREILMTENLAHNDLGSLMMMRKHPLSNYPLVGSSYVGSSYGSDGFSPMPVPINNENFGVQAIRQLVDAARTMGESPAKLVEALALARQHNLTDVIESLEKKLGVSKKLEGVESTAGPEGSAVAPAVPTDAHGRPLQ